MPDDPTDDLREEFIQAIRQRFQRLRDDIERWVGEEDIFGLDEDGQAAATAADLPDDAPDVFRFQSDRQQVGAFLDWLEDRINNEVLEPTSVPQQESGEHWTAAFIRQSYAQGWQEGRARLRTVGVSIGSQLEVEEILQVPVAERDLRRLYTRAYENLESVTDDTAEPVRNTLTEGFAKGWNPRKTARELDQAVEGLQRSRAETLARTETVNAYTDSTVSRYKRAGVDTVQHGEWADANDSRVCPICKQLDGREIPLSGINDETFTFEPDDDEPDWLAGEYPVKPPAHPNGRCVIMPIIS